MPDLAVRRKKFTRRLRAALRATLGSATHDAVVDYFRPAVLAPIQRVDRRTVRCI